jgi:hypothetical protein
MNIGMLAKAIYEIKTIYDMKDLGEDFKKYETNINGYRGPEFLKNVDLVALGCSQSYGIGVPLEGTWADILSKKNNYTYNNLSMPGASIMHIVYNFFNYVDKFGPPKYLICLFPDFYRIRYGWDKEILNPAYTVTNKNKRYGIASFNTNFNENRIFKKYLKLPTDAEDVFPEIHFYHINLLFINFLEIYCKKSNIKLIWTTVDESYKQELKKHYENYFSMDDETTYFNGLSKEAWENAPCHSEYKNDFMDCFDVGFDSKEKDQNGNLKFGHMGAHCHIHYAEAFDKRIKNYLDKNV